MMKHQCIYFIDTFLLKLYGNNLDYILQKKIDLPVLTPQDAIFCFIDVQDQNYLLFNHLLLIFKYNIYNLRANNDLNF